MADNHSNNNSHALDPDLYQELLEWRDRYEVLIHKSAQIFYDWHHATGQASFAGDTQGILGYEPAELSGHWFELIHPKDYQSFKKAYSQSLDKKEPFSHRYRVKKKDGTYVLVKHDGYLFLDDKGDIERMIGFIVDITKEVKELDVLREREKRYRELVESQQELITRVDPDGRFTFVNDAYCKKFGKKKRELIGEAFVLFIHQDDLSDIMDAMKSLETAPYRVYFEHRAFTAQGWRWIAWENYAIKNDHGDTVEVQAIGRDITESKRAEEKLRARTDDLEIAKSQLEEDRAKDDALLSSIGDGIIATNKLGKIIRINKVTEDMLGIKGDEVMGKHLSEVVRMEDVEGNVIPAKQCPNSLALSTGKRTIATAYCYVREDGTKFSAEVTVTPVIRDKKIIGTVEVFRDTTKEMEIDQAKSELVSLASHQLRTPLSIVTWYAEALLKEFTGPISHEQKKYLEEINNATGRMISLVNDFLNVSRIDLGTLDAEPELLKITQVADNVLRELDPKVKEKNLRINTLYHDKVPDLKADPSHLRIVFQNLLINAIKYTSAGGVIDVKISHDESRVLIAISDTGCGIPLSQHHKIFTKLFRADNVKGRDTDGTGLGLYIVKSVLAHCQGKVWFESTEEQGSTFYVSIPVALDK